MLHRVRRVLSLGDVAGVAATGRVRRANWLW